MSEDTSDGFADQPRPMYRCLGCGFNVEREDARKGAHEGHTRFGYRAKCDTCIKCEACPDMRESYRRGFDAGMDTLRRRVESTIRGR